MKIKNKKSILFLFCLALVFIISGVFAYFSNNEVFENLFLSGTYKTVTRETFTSPTNWVPGEETEKRIVTKNEGTIPVRVRVKLDESWTSKNNNPLALEYNNEKVAIINFDNESDWLKKGDYYYYLEELAPGDETSSLIKSVTFNSNVEPDILCTTSNNVYGCESTGDGYDGATYELDITIESVQANKYKEVWDNVPIMYDYVGDNPCTFNGELVPGAEYVNGQYTYRYMKEWGWDSSLGTHGKFGWINISNVGWGVKLTNPESTDPVNTTICSSINNKPIVSMSYMFDSSESSSIDLTSIDTKNVTNMYGMFEVSVATSLDLSKFDTSNCLDMTQMFEFAEATNLDLSKFDTSNVVSMEDMFFGSKATSLDLSNFDTSNVVDMSGMFASCEALSLNLSSFNTKKVTNMEQMFVGIKALSLDLSNFDTSNVTIMKGMFAGCETPSIDLSNFDTSKVIDMSGMFYDSKSTNLVLTSFDTSNVVDMSRMFWNSKVTNLNLSNFNTSKVTDMSRMFQGSLVNVLDLSSFDTSNVTNTNEMFSSASATTGYGKTQADCDRLNASSDKPAGLVFVVKGS